MQPIDEQRAHLFARALEGAAALQGQYPGSRPLGSAVEQLQYLLAVTKGEMSADPERIATINIGVIAAKEVEDMDEGVAELLHQASAQARKMAQDLA